MRERLKKIALLVEANDYERHMLWINYADAAATYRLPSNHTVKWSGAGADGFMVEVGDLAEMPVCVVFTFDQINDKTVVFYHASSQVVDHRMIEKWLRDNTSTPDNGIVPMTSANSFFNAFLTSVR